MSFKVDCAPNYYGPNCTTLCEDDPGVFRCDSIGEKECVNSNKDPLTDCLTCLPHRDPSTDCTTCLSRFDTSTNCIACLSPGLNPNSNCTVCLPGRDPSTNCTSCLPTAIGTYLCQCVSGVNGPNSANADRMTESALGVVLGLSLVATLILAISLSIMCFKYRQLRNHSQSGNDEWGIYPRYMSCTAAIIVIKYAVWCINFFNTENNTNHAATSSEHTQDTVDDIQLHPNVLYTRDSRTENENGDQTTVYANEGLATRTTREDTDTSSDYESIL